MTGEQPVAATITAHPALKKRERTAISVGQSKSTTVIRGGQPQPKPRFNINAPVLTKKYTSIVMGRIQKNQMTQARAETTNAPTKYDPEGSKLTQEADP